MKKNNPDYCAHHSPFGAFASFTLGRFGATGGFGLERGRPATQDVYIGFARGAEPLQLLPFFPSAGKAPKKDPADGRKLHPLWPLPGRIIPGTRIRREMGWASDTWTAGPFTFRLLTPFGCVTDPAHGKGAAFQRAILPAILGELSLDNRESRQPAKMVFGIGSRDQDLHAFNIPGLAGVTGGNWGFAARAGRGLIASEDGRTGLITFTVPARSIRRFTIALGFHREGIVTTGLPCSYLYSKHYRNLGEVLRKALAVSKSLKNTAQTRDRELARSRLSPARRFLLAHATHSYHGSTQLLSRQGKPVWVVNEGEYRMLNTLDLTADQLFFEMKFHPWTTRNVLDHFASRYSYTDRLRNPKGGTLPGGISFCHDMGVNNRFWPRGRSSYEKPECTGVSSYMTQEELVNWTACACVYGAKDPGWLPGKHGILSRCLDSMLDRDNPVPGLRDGIMKHDSTRCGKSGREITTYDSLDSSLAQASNNLYLSVKSWGTLMALARTFRSLKDRKRAREADHEARLCAGTVASKYLAGEGYIPAVFEAGNTSRIIPAVEGLLFPFLLGDRDAVSPGGRFSALIGVLRAHITTIMRPGTCIDRKSGCWVLSSTSRYTWPSKYFLSAFVLEKVLKMDMGGAYSAGDSAMVRWQTEGCRDWAFTDQLNAFTGKDLGSRYYPRGVSSILMM